MRRWLYHRFPNRADFEQRYRYRSDLAHFLRVMASLNKKFGLFEVELPKGGVGKAKREFSIGIAERGIDFTPLLQEKVESIAENLKGDGVIDFKLDLKYSYLASEYLGIPFKGDTFLLRASLEGDVLTLIVNHIDGPGKTTSTQVANTIVEEIRLSHE
ncbi:MAG: hypothetical protein QXJ68_07535 [Methanocellales archaeon]